MAVLPEFRSVATGAHLGLLTDKYELTMLEGFIGAGIQDRRAQYELFGRKLPTGRRFGVVGGSERAVEAVMGFRFQDEDLKFLGEFLNDDVLSYLADYRFSGNVRGYREGDYWFPFSPLLTVESTLGEATVLETLLLSIFNYDSAVGSAASHISLVAGGTPLMEFGSRRTSEQSAVFAARMAYICGFSSTSNLEAGRRFGVPVFGTSAHAFTLAFRDERKAFEAQVKSFGVGTTVLVDTYDIEQGVVNAVEVAGTKLGGVRIDSGDPFVVVPEVRAQLNSLGAWDTKIVLSGDLNADMVARIVAAGLPVDSFGVGSSVVTGDGFPAAGFVYKLVSVEDEDGSMVSVAKKASGGKKSIGGAKRAYREFDSSWNVVAEHLLTVGSSVEVDPLWVSSQVELIHGGDVVGDLGILEARDRHWGNQVNHPVRVDVRSFVDEDEVWGFTPTF